MIIPDLSYFRKDMPENSEVSPDPWTAAKSGDFDKIQDYIQKQGDPNAKNDDGFTLLHKACVGGQVRVAKFLLDNGASVNGVTKVRFANLCYNKILIHVLGCIF